jgi:hypothetical protein
MGQRKQTSENTLYWILGYLSNKQSLDEGEISMILGVINDSLDSKPKKEILKG